MNIKKTWDKIAGWQKKLALIASIIASVVFIYPYAKTVMDHIKIFVQFQSQAIHIEQTLQNHDEYLLVLSGILKSSLEKLDDKTYGVELYVENPYNDEKRLKMVEAQLRKTRPHPITKKVDVFVWVDDGKTGMYSVKWSKDNQRYAYIDFDGNEHQIYEADFSVTIKK